MTSTITNYFIKLENNFQEKPRWYTRYIYIIMANRECNQNQQHNVSKSSNCTVGKKMETYSAINNVSQRFLNFSSSPPKAPLRSRSIKKILKNVGFSFWGKKCGFPKLLQIYIFRILSPTVQLNMILGARGNHRPCFWSHFNLLVCMY